MSLKGKNLVVIGGTSGLGRSAAAAFIREGARVVVAGRNGEKVESTASELGDSCCGLVGDARDPAFAGEAIALCLSRYGSLEGLYHVAGGSGREAGDGPIHEATDEGIDFTLELNLKSVLYSNRAAVRQFLGQGTGGAILNMGSVLGYSPSKTFFASHVYAATKSAIVGLSRSLAACYAGDDIRVNVLAPALVDTPMATRAMSNDAIQEFIRTKQPLDGGRTGIPSDADGAAVLFFSDAGRYITGQVLSVDGGWSVSEGQWRGEEG